MNETIYTIPINEAFDACAADPSCGCPFCRLYNMLETNEIDIILGAAMMEPDIRKKTNEQGFCPTHFDQLLAAKNRLGLALILESHLDQLRGEVEEHGLTALLKKTGTAAVQRLGKLDETCYVCGRIEASFTRMLSNALYLWTEDEAFREKVQTWVHGEEPKELPPPTASLLRFQLAREKEIMKQIHDPGSIKEAEFDATYEWDPREQRYELQPGTENSFAAFFTQPRYFSFTELNRRSLEYQGVSREQLKQLLGLNTYKDSEATLLLEVLGKDIRAYFHAQLDKLTQGK